MFRLDNNEKESRDSSIFHGTGGVLLMTMKYLKMLKYELAGPRKGEKHLLDLHDLLT
jgi:hypothetical protein